MTLMKTVQHFHVNVCHLICECVSCYERVILCVNVCHLMCERVSCYECDILCVNACHLVCEHVSSYVCLVMNVSSCVWTCHLVCEHVSSYVWMWVLLWMCHLVCECVSFCVWSVSSCDILMPCAFVLAKIIPMHWASGIHYSHCLMNVQTGIELWFKQLFC
jgi:hypothetical protein